jgi:hypothetical protein
MEKPFRRPAEDPISSKDFCASINNCCGSSRIQKGIVA